MYLLEAATTPAAPDPETTMADITLFLTRKPKDEFTQINGKNIDTTTISDADRNRLYGRTGAWTAKAPGNKLANGIWGTLGVMQGPKVLSARLTEEPATNLSKYATDDAKSSGAATVTRYAVFADRVLEYQTKSNGATVEAFKEYTTAERYRGDFGGVGGDDGYVMLQPRPSAPYSLRTEPGNEVVKTLRPGYNGNCLRILGTTRPKEDAILIHECPSIGWVIGCIGPRPLGNYDVLPNQDGNPSHLSITEIYNQINAKGSGQATLVVLDW
jgi:hypothetical protein